MAARSHARAAAATNSGRFRDEIVPVETTWKDPKTGEEKTIVVDKDDGIREGVTAAQLGKLPAVFKKGGSTTAGNSSQVPYPLIVPKVGGVEDAKGMCVRHYLPRWLRSVSVVLACPCSDGSKIDTL
jgi:hypothetical protein